MKNWWKWLLGVVTLLLILFSLGAWYFSRHWKPIVDFHLKELVHTSSHGLYTLKYASMNINPSFGNISLDQVELIPDSAIYSRLVQEKKAPNNQFHIKLKALRIKHFSLADIFFSKKLSISSIKFEEPNIQVINQHHAFNDSLEGQSQPKKRLYDYIKKTFKSIAIGKIELDTANFVLTRVQQSERHSVNFRDVSIKVADVLIDSTSFQDTSRFFYAKLIDIYLPSFSYDLPGNLYKVTFKDLRINTLDKSLAFSNVVYSPRMNKKAFYSLVKKNVTMNDVQMGKVKLNNVSFKKLLNQKEFYAQSMNVSNGRASFYQDMRYPKVRENVIGKAPYEQLMKIKSAFHVDTVYIKNVLVQYSEYSDQSGQVGTITFAGTSGILTNVTNNRKVLAKNRFMYADLYTKVMDVGKLHVKFGFDMLRSGGYYTYAGTVSPMSASAFNRILVPLANVEIMSGDIKKISFNMQATNYRNWGTFKFDYDSLNVNILRSPKDNEDAKAQKTISFLVNKVLINSSNPDSNGKHNVGTVNYNRVPEYPFFKTIWKSLLQGITQCVGISPEREAKLLKLAASSSKVVSGIKHGAHDVGTVAKDVGQAVGKEASKAFHGVDSFFKKTFKKKNNTQD